MRPSRKYDGFCMHCARKIEKEKPGTFPEAIISREIRQKQREAHQKALKNVEKSGEKNQFIPEEIEVAMHPHDYNLKEQYELYKEVDPDKKFGNAAGIYAYSDWYHADPLTRVPQIKIDVAEILDVSTQTLYRWEKMNLFKKARLKHLEDVLEYGLGAEITTAVALTNAKNGSEKAIEIINKRVEKRQKERGDSRNPFDFMSEKDKAEAQAIVGEEKIDKRTPAGKLASQSIDNMFIEGEPIDGSKLN